MQKKHHPTLTKLVTLLSDGDYHDGNQLGECLGVTRSAIWKMIQKLLNYGVMIQCDKKKGYVLDSSLCLLDPKKIQSQLKPHTELYLFESVDSTNDYLKRLPKSKKPQVCLAEHQTQGKGRMQRKWYSPFGQNLYLSYRYSFQKDVSALSGLSLVTGLATLNTIKQFIDAEIQVKWPNDIFYEFKKLSGCLIELQAESHGDCHAIVGIGINVNMLEDAQNVEQAWTSMRKISNQYVDRNRLASELINQLSRYFQRFQIESFQTFMDEWNSQDCLINKMIIVKNGNEQMQGEMIGVNEQGFLSLKMKDGKIKILNAGDVTIIK